MDTYPGRAAVGPFASLGYGLVVLVRVTRSGTFECFPEEVSNRIPHGALSVAVSAEFVDSHALDM